MDRNKRKHIYLNIFARKKTVAALVFNLEFFFIQAILVLSGSNFINNYYNLLAVDSNRNNLEEMIYIEIL